MLRRSWSVPRCKEAIPRIGAVTLVAVTGLIWLQSFLTADVAGNGALLRARSALHDLLVQLLVHGVDGAVDLGVRDAELMRD